ncbi:unnamed protein product [Orchesella dallaii]|uniref:C-type lectin domain-containing protein n=1 Tax=Orchesella dallaii TaxID=48710 RepID=A0ABP1Q6W4_9HEXA
MDCNTESFEVFLQYFGSNDCQLNSDKANRFKSFLRGFLSFVEMKVPSFGSIFFLHSLLGMSFSGTIFENNLSRILETQSSKYFLSNEATDPETATQICQSNNGKLISIENLEENLLVSEKLREIGIETVWLSGIKYSNATIEHLYLWTSTGEPFGFTNFHESTETGSANLKRSVRDRRSATLNNNDDCFCNCTTTLPPPFTPPPCRVPSCNITIPDPICEELVPRSCIVPRAPICNSKRDNCSVDCQSEGCRVIKQPVCTVIPGKTLCRLESNLGKCETKRPKCTIVKPGSCRAQQDPCSQDNTGTCEPVTTPCKNACTERPCETTQPPCVTTQPPCVTTTCPPKPPCEKVCVKKADANCLPGGNCKPVETCELKCPPIPPCSPACPEPIVICPPPVTSCRKPFVDCSPEFCQSSVQICRPPKVSCPPPRIICEPPQTECSHPEVICPDPEVICEEAEVECSKPVVESCDPILTTCEATPHVCSDAFMSCKDPTISCQDPVTCPVVPIEPPTRGPCICAGAKSGTKCGKRGRVKRESSLPETEFVETRQCVAMRKDLGFKWDTQNCKTKHRFICEEGKVEERRVLDFLF